MNRDYAYRCTSLISDCSLNTTLDAPQSPTENNFSSPYYPLGFPMNMTCGWFITAPENQTVKLQLTSRLSSSYKSSDRVEVYDVDGSELSANSLRLSNPHANTDTIYSKFRSLYILFKSDSHPQQSLSDSGITVLYTAFETGESNYLTTQECIIPKPFSFGYFPACGWIQDAWRDLVVFASFLLTPTSCTKSEHRLYYTRLEVVGTRKNGRARRRHACHTPCVSLARARSFTTSKRLLCRLDMVKCCQCHYHLSLICHRFVIVCFHLYNLECYTFWR